MRQAIRSHAARFPDKLAIASSNQSLTWKGLHERIQAMTRTAAPADQRKAVVQLEHDTDTLVCILGLLFNGYAVMLAEPGFPLQDWSYIQETLRPDLLIRSEKHSDNDFGSILQFTAKEACDYLQEDRPSACGYRPAEGSVFFQTSGSTGRPKYIQRLVPALEAEAHSYIASFQLTEHDVFLAATPIYHSFTFGSAFLTAMFCGGTLVVSPLFFPRYIMRLIHDYKVTVMPIIPALVGLLVRSVHTVIESVPLRHVIVGTGRASVADAALFRELFGCGLSGNYGSTETGGLTIRDPDTPPGEETVGRPMAGVDFRIVDEANEPVPDGAVGSVQVRTLALCSKSVDENGEKSIQTEWWDMGDTGFLDSTGRLCILGRKSTIIRRYGKQINPEVIERTLSAFDGVLEAAAGSYRKGDSADQMIIAILVFDELFVIPPEEKLKGMVFERLGFHYIPDKIFMASNLPRNKTGKVDRVLLQQAIQELMK